MANDTILTPGSEYQATTPISEETQYLERDKYLSEYDTEGEKAVVRENLDVYAKGSVYTKLESDTKLSEALKTAFEKYLGQDDPHGILPKVTEMIKSFVKEDGSTPFTAPQLGVDPIQDLHLVTKRFVNQLLKDHINSEDPHEILPEVKDLLERYVKVSDIYQKSQLYTKQEIDSQALAYLRKDGSTSFTKPQIGIDPQIDSHLATKRYVDKVLYQHLVDVDPHKFLSILNNRLGAYIKRAEVYDKTETYSRTQIDNNIQTLVNQAIGASLSEYISSVNDKFENIRKQRYIKQDGSIPFTSPQIGTDATADNELTTLGQVNTLITGLQESLSNQIASKECEWITSGPVIGSAGLVEVGTEFAKTVSLQEIMDAIFYGKGINITAAKFGKIGESVDVEVCVQGSLAELEHAELYQNGKLIQTFTKAQFEEQTCITVKSEPISEDTEFVFKAIYVNGSTHDVSAWTKVALPIFIGLLPKWKFGNTVTYDYLIQLYTEDEDNNQFYDYGKNLKSINHNYSFANEGLQHFIMAIPADYPDLYQMCTPSQQFGKEAFDIIDMIPFQLPNVEKDMVYKLYIYREAQIRADIPVTFNFVEQ